MYSCVYITCHITFNIQDCHWSGKDAYKFGEIGDLVVLCSGKHCIKFCTLLLFILYVCIFIFIRLYSFNVER